MPYEYSNPKAMKLEPYAHLDVEVFHSNEYSLPGEDFYYAYGFPGEMWDSKPVGPFPTYQEALEDAQRGGDCHEDYDPKVDR